MIIPKIIHQVWEGRTLQMPIELSKMANTWKAANPGWEYKFWNNEQMINLVSEKFPDFQEIYNEFPEGVQRWDAIRYLILFIHGGVYADLDSECLRPLDTLLENKLCCFGMEPPKHCSFFNVEYLIGNAFMAATPNQPFFKRVIEEIKNYKLIDKQVSQYVLETTGPLMLNRVYSSYPNKEEIDLISFKLVTPISSGETLQIIQGKKTTEISDKLNKAYAVHYFFNLWAKNDKGASMNNLLNRDKE